MLGAEKKTKTVATAKPGLVLAQEALAAAQVDFRAQLVVMWSKVRVEKMWQLQVREEGAVARSTYARKKAQLMGGVR